MTKRTILSRAVKLACAGLVTGGVLASGVAAAEEEAAKLEKVSVTGSLIKKVDIEGANPVTVMDREAIERTGVTDVGELLQRLPSFSGSPIGTRTNNGGDGSVYVDLRGMGPERTLVLINGRRVADPDFQTIPAAMIERIDILKDGASTTYGADAVAGVVNIITRKDFEGVEVQLQYSDSMETDSGDLKQASAVFGHPFRGGHVMFGVDYSKQEETLQQDTDWDFMQHSYFIIDGPGFSKRGFVTPKRNPDNFTVVPVGSSRIPNGNFNLNGRSGSLTLIDGRPGTSPTDFRPYNGDVFDPNNDTYNYAPVNYIQTPYERTNGFFEGSFELTDSISAFAEFRISQRDSDQQLAPVPYDSQYDPGYKVPVLDEDGNVVEFANGISKDNLYNPFGEDVIRARRRMIERSRTFEQDVSQYQSVLGLQGDIDGNWNWEAYWNHGYRKMTDVSRGQLYGPYLANALGPSFLDANGKPTCGTPDAPIAGCVPANMFGGPGSMTNEMYGYLEAKLVDSYKTELDVVNATINGDIMELPAGPLGSAFGVEYRDESYTYDPDSAKAKGEVTGNTGPGVDGSYDVKSVFAELNVPIVADMPFAEVLEVGLGLRYDDYSTFGGNTVAKGSFRWQPVPDLLVRGTVGDVFREPSVSELFQPELDNFPQAQDPCAATNWGNLTPTQQNNCVAQGVPQGGHGDTDTQIRQKVGGNRDLQPEQGTTYTLGFVWSPGFLEGFSTSVDYWDIDLDDAIKSIDPETALNECTDNRSLCDLIHRNFDGTIDYVEGNLQNLSNEKARGVDFALGYNYSTDHWGDWAAHLGWTHLLERSKVEFKGASRKSFEGTGDYDSEGNFKVFPEDKVNLALTWNFRSFRVDYQLEYISSVDVPVSFIDYVQDIDSQVYHDIVGTWSATENLDLTLGVTNFTNEEPPYIDAGFNASTDPSTYRMFGRSWFARAKLRF